MTTNQTAYTIVYTVGARGRRNRVEAVRYHQIHAESAWHAKMWFFDHLVRGTGETRLVEVRTVAPVDQAPLQRHDRTVFSVSAVA